MEKVFIQILHVRNIVHLYKKIAIRKIKRNTNKVSFYSFYVSNVLKYFIFIFKEWKPIYIKFFNFQNYFHLFFLLPL